MIDCGFINLEMTWALTSINTVKDTREKNSGAIGFLDTPKKQIKNNRQADMKLQVSGILLRHMIS